MEVNSLRFYNPTGIISKESLEQAVIETHSNFKPTDIDDNERYDKISSKIISDMCNDFCPDIRYKAYDNWEKIEFKLNIDMWKWESEWVLGKNKHFKQDFKNKIDKISGQFEHDLTDILLTLNKDFELSKNINDLILIVYNCDCAYEQLLTHAVSEKKLKEDKHRAKSLTQKKQKRDKKKMKLRV